jgi:hypothetical protein
MNYLISVQPHFSDKIEDVQIINSEQSAFQKDLENFLAEVDMNGYKVELRIILSKTYIQKVLLKKFNDKKNDSLLKFLQDNFPEIPFELVDLLK